MSQEPEVLPAMIPCAYASVRDIPGVWCLAQVKPFPGRGNERRLVVELDAKRVGYFMPLLRRVSYAHRQRHTVSVPLFPAYVFVCCGSDNDRHELIKTGRTVRIIDSPRQRELIDDLARIERSLAVNPDLPRCAGVAKGKVYRITSGPYMGIEGEVTFIDAKRARVSVLVKMLGRGVDLNVDVDLLEPC